MSKIWKWESKKLNCSSAITSALTWKCFYYHALLKLSSIIICFLVLCFGEAWLVFCDQLQVQWVAWNQVVNWRGPKEGTHVPLIAWGNCSHMVGGFTASLLGSSSLSLCSPTSACNIFLGRGWAIPEINSIDRECSSSLTFWSWSLWKPSCQVRDPN